MEAATSQDKAAPATISTSRRSSSVGCDPHMFLRHLEFSVQSLLQEHQQGRRLLEAASKAPRPRSPSPPASTQWSPALTRLRSKAAAAFLKTAEPAPVP
ncbi:hypothetical protein V5799_020684 [Amblyomma americanum]|uniref:Uncharacterized protein n=1 Tax=Amblyomma americanum TaxID=6943 RepID=A0AAQ4ETM0_AMBAM